MKEKKINLLKVGVNPEILKNRKRCYFNKSLGGLLFLFFFFFFLNLGFILENFDQKKCKKLNFGQKITFLALFGQNFQK